MKSTECKNRMIPLTFLRSTFWLNRPSLSLFALFCQSVRLIHQNSSDNCVEENQNRVFTRVSILYEEKRREKNRGKSKIYNIPISQLYRIVSNSCETQTRIRRNYERSSLSLSRDSRVTRGWRHEYNWRESSSSWKFYGWKPIQI